MDKWVKKAKNEELKNIDHWIRATYNQNSNLRPGANTLKNGEMRKKGKNEKIKSKNWNEDKEMGGKIKTTTINCILQTETGKYTKPRHSGRRSQSEAWALNWERHRQISTKRAIYGQTKVRNATWMWKVLSSFKNEAGNWKNVNSSQRN